MKLKRQNRKLSKFLLWLFIVLSPLSLPAAELIDDAGALEREGETEEARSLYIKWLSLPDSAASDRFGRILIHALRMPAPLNEDLDLIERHLDRLGPGSDRDQVLETAVIIAELAGRSELKEKYLKLLSPTSASSRDSAVVRLKKLPGTKYGILDSLKSTDSSIDLVSEIEAVHREYPDFLFQADWLFEVQKLLSDRGYGSEAAVYRNRLKSSFPYSIEASLLKGEVSLLQGPEAYLGGDFSDTEVIAVNGSQDTVDEGASEPVPLTLYQAGAFSSPVNADLLKNKLQAAGLSASVRREGSAYKVVVESRDDQRTLDILESMDIKGFRIAP